MSDNLCHAIEKSEGLKTNEEPKSEYYDETRIFYVCSYGGCGSWMLCHYLENFGKVFHIHSRYPPNHLTYVGKLNDTNRKSKILDEWFNNIPIKNEDLCKYTVIYLYKNPIRSILSRFIGKNNTNDRNHLKNIQCDKNGNIKLNEVLRKKEDLYKLEEFFDNYTKATSRNYKMYCVKYEEFWKNIKSLNETINIPDIQTLYPSKKETIRNQVFLELNHIYSPLIKKMNELQFIEIR
jgi:hypothetical protein